jgi:hypothetical protein
MKPPLQYQIRFMRFFWGVKPGFADFCSVKHYLRSPLTLMSADAKQTNFIGFSGFSHILKVAVSRHLAQIAETVVALVPIYVVDMLRGPFTRYISPRKTVREVLTVINGYSPVTCRLSRSRGFADKIRSLFMREPCKETRIGVVMKRRPEMFNSAWRFNCHDNAFTIGMA